ncbi:MAG: hypothetical protein HZC47_06470 [Methanobacterium sp.]|uniref:hypothetical protein n=1 Tax=Methanobacterium sp. TaxID=2164 RepID=UPI003D65F2EF|nr:hypothetical protein [Methanobacterium sp.]
MLIDYFKGPAEEYVLGKTPINLLNAIMRINNELESQSQIIKWTKTENKMITGGFPVEIHSKDSKNQSNLYINEEYSKYVAETLCLQKPEWEEGKYNSEIVELMLHNFTISDIIQIEKLIKHLLYERSKINSMDYKEGIPSVMELPLNPCDQNELEDIVNNFFKNNNVTDSLKNYLGRLLIKYCLYYAFYF